MQSCACGRAATYHRISSLYFNYLRYQCFRHERYIIDVLSTGNPIANAAGSPITIEVIKTTISRNYDGEIDSTGNPHGKEKMTWYDGDEYEGNWRHNRREGKGKYRWADGSIYEGDWKNDEREGRGTYWVGGNEYEGG